MHMARSVDGGLAARRAAPPKAARTWWVVHQWVGLKLSLFLSFIMFTGTLAVVSHEIDWLLQPSLRVAPSTAQGPVAWERIGYRRCSSVAAPNWLSPKPWPPIPVACC
ncbi:PepSY domain-containing protein [Leptolyngbya sp. 15MV]|nr:PepSY domain-containing protein [Leptolyngbya sp. 15MV]